MHPYFFFFLSDVHPFDEQIYKNVPGFGTDDIFSCQLEPEVVMKTIFGNVT